MADPFQQGIMIDDLATGRRPVKASDFGPTVEMIIFAGQSQASSLGAAIGDVPTNLQAMMPTAYVWDYIAQTWTNYQAGVTSALYLQGGKYPTVGATFWGGEAEYLRRYIANNPGKNVYIVKIAHSATSLDQAARTANKGCWDPALRNELYDFLVRAVTQATANLNRAGLRVNKKAIIWVQGEADTGNATAANNYQTNLTALVDACRKDLSLESAPFIISRINGGSGSADTGTVRTAQTAVGDTKPLCRWINCDDIPLGTDAVHYSGVGVVEQGRREYLASMDAAEAYASFAPKLGSALNAAQIYAVKDLLAGLINASIYPTLEILQLFGMPDQVSALANVMPFAYTGVNSGMTFTAKSGFTGASANSFIDTSFVPSLSALVKERTAAYTFNIGTNNTPTGLDIGYSASGTLLSALITPSVSTTFRIHSTSITVDNTFTPAADVRGTWTIQRTGATASAIYQEGVLQKADAVNASAANNVPIGSIWVGSRNPGANGTTGRLYRAFAAGTPHSVAMELQFAQLLSTFIANMAAS